MKHRPLEFSANAACIVVWCIIGPATGAYMGYHGMPVWASMIVAPGLFMLIIVVTGLRRKKESDTRGT